MIDIYAPEGTFSNEDIPAVLQRLTECLLRWTDAGDIPIARDNSGAYLHVLPVAHVTANGKPAPVVRVDVKLPEVVLSTIERRRGFIADATHILNALRSKANAVARTWVTVSNTADGGWGIGGHGFTNAELDEI